MSQTIGAKGRNLASKPRKHPTQSEVARHQALVKRYACFRPMMKLPGDEKTDTQEDKA
jgi:hypothetical protein